MTETLEAQGDTLLRKAHGLGKSHGVYTEAQLAQRTSRERQSNDSDHRAPMSAALLECIREDIEHLHLSDRQKLLLTCAFDGATSCRELADVLGIHPATVARDWRYIRRQVSSQDVWAWATICEVFRDPVMQSNWPKLLKMLSGMMGI